MTKGKKTASPCYTWSGVYWGADIIAQYSVQYFALVGYHRACRKHPGLRRHCAKCVSVVKLVYDGLIISPENDSYGRLSAFVLKHTGHGRKQCSGCIKEDATLQCPE